MKVKILQEASGKSLEASINKFIEEHNTVRDVKLDVGGMVWHALVIYD
jgi:hypothetical protein